MTEISLNRPDAEAIEKMRPEYPPLTNFNTDQALVVVWTALHGYREDCIPVRYEKDRRPNADPGDHVEVDDYAEEWDEICTAMAWLKDALDNFATEQNIDKGIIQKLAIELKERGHD